MASQGISTWKTTSPPITGDITFIPVFTVIKDGKSSSTTVATCPKNEYVSSASAGISLSSSCKTGYAGTMTWKCGNDGKWTSNEDNCKKSTIIDGVPDNYVYYGGAAAIALLLILLI